MDPPPLSDHKSVFGLQKFYRRAVSSSKAHSKGWVVTVKLKLVFMHQWGPKEPLESYGTHHRFASLA